jgi:GAF domain-containing protein
MIDPCPNELQRRSEKDRLRYTLQKIEAMGLADFPYIGENAAQQMQLLAKGALAEQYDAHAQRALDMPLARSIAHKHCTCTCRDDPKVMQGHTNFCDEITKAISEYISAVTSTERSRDDGAG